MITKKCRSASCGADILWATHHPAGETSSKFMPIHKDSLRDPGGNLEVWKDASGYIRWRYIREGERELEPQPGHFRAMSHYVYCPDAEAWRARNRAR